MNGPLGQKPEYRLGIGIPSVIMILLVLAMTSFGVLSFMSGRADMALSRRSTEMTEAYYQAAANAQEALCELDGRMAAMRALATDENDYLSLLSQWADQAGWTLSEDRLYQFFPAGQARELYVAVHIMPLYAQGPRYRLETHTLTANEALFEQEEYLPLYQ